MIPRSAKFFSICSRFSGVTKFRWTHARSSSRRPQMRPIAVQHAVADHDPGDHHREHDVPAAAWCPRARPSDAGRDDRQLLRDREPEPGREQGDEHPEVAVLVEVLQHQAVRAGCRPVPGDPDSVP